MRRPYLARRRLGVDELPHSGTGSTAAYGAAEALTNPPSTNIASAFRSKAEPCALSFALHRWTPSTSLPSDRCPVHTIFPTAFTRNHRRLLRPHFGRTPGAAHQTHMSDHLAGSSEPPTKRRKVRKGTRSCWECKPPRSCPISTCPGGPSTFSSDLQNRRRQTHPLQRADAAPRTRKSVCESAPEIEDRHIGLWAHGNIRDV